jgi:hypothetical protein
LRAMGQPRSIMSQKAGNPGKKNQHRNPPPLIDISDDEAASLQKQHETASYANQELSIPNNHPHRAHLLDDSSITTHSAAPRTNSDLISFSSVPNPVAESILSNESASYVNTVAYRGPNISAMKNAHLQKLRAMGQPRSIMSQKAGNPSKKNQPKQESKAEKKKRIQMAMNDAHGKSLAVTPTPVQPPKTAEAGPQARKAQPVGQATQGLIHGLKEILESSRSLNGEVRLEFKIGQLLISNHSSLAQTQVKVRTWERMFGSSTTNEQILTSFTPALTTNGADIDRALEVKSFRGGKLWNSSSPGPQCVHYQFECETKHGARFLLVLDEAGEFELISDNDAVIGMVGLHCPSQVWDACVVVSGTLKWTASAEILISLQEFVGSIHIVPNRNEVTMYFHQPEDNQLMIKNVTMKRLSRHYCLAPGHEQTQLQVTEVKSLFTKINPDDKKLWQAFEKTFLEMDQEAAIHFEVSIVNTRINEQLSQNKFLELGELAPTALERELLRPDQMNQLLELTAHMVKRIDWIGSQNYGTLFRAATATIERHRRAQASLSPLARSRIDPIISASRIDPMSRLGIRSGYSNSPMSATGSELTVKRTLAGVRSGTLAPVYEDEQGRYYRSYGGARVPVADGEQTLGTISESPLGPDDSASQYGRHHRPVRPARRGYSDVGMHNQRGPGFW